MRSTRNTLLMSAIVGMLVAISAWPIYVAVNLGISSFSGEGSIIDLWSQEPKRTLIASFLAGYKSSAIIATAIGFIAALDFLLLANKKLAGYIAGLSIPATCTAVAFVFYAEPIPFVFGFVLTGIALWIVYKLIDIACRLRRAV